MMRGREAFLMTLVIMRCVLSEHKACGFQVAGCVLMIKDVRCSTAIIDVCLRQMQSSRNGFAILVVPTKRVLRIHSRYPLRSKGGHGGNREHSAPATATPPTSKARHP
eukprot:1154432-Pelagomonas_calceolata.AAC.1